MGNIFKIDNNIYITSDEEIKKGDWFYVPNQMMGFEHVSNEWFDGLDSIYAKKIILTTDTDLISNGVPTMIGHTFTSLSYEDFRNIASNELLEEFDKDYSRYSDDACVDDHFYAHCRYWENKVK